MAYTINKTDGTVLTTLIDATVDETTDLTLIGKNYSGFGEIFNENLIKLLENFSNISAPERPIVGQIWYDTGEQRLKVYAEAGWKSAGGTIVSDTSPLSFTTGDLWIDNNENQLWFFDGSDLILSGPIWKRSQGKTGLVVETLSDANGNAKHVLFLYVSDALLGIFSAEEFTPLPALAGFTSLVKGFNANAQISSVFGTTVTNALNLNNISSSQFMRSDQSTYNKTKILIQNDQGLTIGATQIADFKISGTTLVIENIASGADISLKTTNNTGTYNPIYIDSSANRVGIFTTNPQQTLDVEGTVRIRGDLIVEGDNVEVHTSTLKVEDKNIELAYLADSISSDVGADGAGIIIRGVPDKTILFNTTNMSFDVSDNFNLNLGKVYRIGNVEVLSGNRLAPAITTAPGLVSIGTLESLRVDYLNLNNNRITATEVNQDIELEPNGTGNIALLNNPRITGVDSPVDPTDAANKQYTDLADRAIPLSLSIIDNGLTGAINENIILFLNDIADPVKFIPTKEAFVHVQHIDSVHPHGIARYLKKFVINSSLQWEFVSDLTSSI